MNRRELEERIREFANGNTHIDITAFNNNLKISLTVELWVDYISQLLGIPDEAAVEILPESPTEEPAEILEGTPVEE